MVAINNFTDSKNMKDLEKRYAEEGIKFRNSKEIYKKAKEDWWKLNRPLLKDVMSSEPREIEYLPTIELGFGNKKYKIKGIIHGDGDCKLKDGYKSWITESLGSNIWKLDDTFFERGVGEILYYTKCRDMNDVDRMHNDYPELKAYFLACNFIGLPLFPIIMVRKIYRTAKNLRDRKPELPESNTPSSRGKFVNNVFLYSIKDRDRIDYAWAAAASLTLPVQLEIDYCKRNKFVSAIVYERSRYMAEFLKSRKTDKPINAVVGLAHAEGIAHYLKAQHREPASIEMKGFDKDVEKMLKPKIMI